MNKCYCFSQWYRPNSENGVRFIAVLEPQPWSVEPLDLNNWKVIAPRNFGCGIRNPEIEEWKIRNPVHRNPESHLRLESKFHWPRIWNTVPGIRNPRRGIQNPRLSWIPLSGVKPPWGGGGIFVPVAFVKDWKKNIIVQDVENLHVDQNSKKNDPCFSPLSLLFSYLFKDIKCNPVF